MDVSKHLEVLVPLAGTSRFHTDAAEDTQTETRTIIKLCLTEYIKYIEFI